LTQKFLVGTVPCLINFAFDNEFSWMREKVVTYKITVTPPTLESMVDGRRRRAKACTKAVDDDLKSAEQRLEAATQQKVTLASDIEKLQKELEDKKRSLQVAAKEESWLKDRVLLRQEQRKLLAYRLTKGWEDEGEQRQGK
jgi:septal ring factor EnvC (AmiA/AmiB activator)